MGEIMGNPVIVSGPYTGRIGTSGIERTRLKVENIEWYAYASGANCIVRKGDAAGHVYAEIRSTLSGGTASRDYDGMWFRDPYISACTSGVLYIYTR